MKTPSDAQVLVLEGSNRQRGQGHGEALRPQIKEYADRWKNNLHQATGMNPEEYLARFLAETDFLAAVERWTPDMAEEVRGIAEGTGLDFDTAFGLQMIDEEWCYRQGVFSEGAASASAKCSALGVFGQNGHPPLVAQNLDLFAPDYYSGLKVLLHVKDPSSAVEAYVFTLAGVIGAMGLNNQPVGVCVNTVIADLNHSSDGLPVAFIIRGILAQPNLEAAAEFIQRIKHASPQNYTIGGAEGVASYECSANQVSQLKPEEGAVGVCHTNHAIVNDDRHAIAEGKDIFSGMRPNSAARLDSLENRLRKASPPLTVETVKAILGAHDSPEHPVCVHGDPGEETVTVASMIAVLSSPPQLHIALGPPCLTEFETFTL